jgi:hypothetical protein
VDLGVAVKAREDAGNNDTVLEGIASTRGRLGEVRQDAELARGIPHEVHGDIEELLTAGQANLVALAQEADVAENKLRRQHASAQQVAGTVQVGKDQVEQLGTLDHGELDTGPFLAGEQHGHRVERPGGGGRGANIAGPLLPVDVVGDPVVIEQAARL